MKFNKRILVTAVSTALFLNAVDTMAAIVNVDTTAASPVALSYTKGLTTLALADNLAAAPTYALPTGLQNILGSFSPLAIPLGSSIQLKVTLSGGAKFTATPDLIPTAAVAPAFSAIVGGAGASTVTFAANTITGPAGGVPVNSTYAIDVKGITVVDTTTPVSVTIETSIVAGGGFTVVKTVTAPYIAFNDALTFKCATTPNTAIVDVTKNSLLFTTASPSKAATNGTVQLVTPPALTPPGELPLDATTVAIADADTVLASGAVKLTLANSWGAAFNAPATPTGADGSIFITSAAANATVSGADATTNYALGTLNAGLSAAKTVTLTATGLTQIPTGAVTATFTGVAKAGFSAFTGTCSLGSITKNGSEDRLTMLLTPNGAYAGLFRITNPSTTSGKVYLTVIDDAGVQTSKTLTQLTGTPAIASDTLAAGASTRLINVNELGVATTGKLRLIANGDFGASNNSEASQSPVGINLQALSISKSGDSFSMMQAK